MACTMHVCMPDWHAATLYHSLKLVQSLHPHSEVSLGCAVQVYAVAVGEPSFGNVGPFAVGLALFAMVFAGSQYTGTAINPARAFGPAAVYHCYWNQVWLYCIAGQQAALPTASSSLAKGGCSTLHPPAGRQSVKHTMCPAARPAPGLAAVASRCCLQAGTVSHIMRPALPCCSSLCNTLAPASWS